MLALDGQPRIKRPRIVFLERDTASQNKKSKIIIIMITIQMEKKGAE